MHIEFVGVAPGTNTTCWWMTQLDISIMPPSLLASRYSCNGENKAALSLNLEHARKILSFESIRRASFVVPVAAAAMPVAQIFSSNVIKDS